jgi:membrane protein DedA with SNARE-associated domain
LRTVLERFLEFLRPYLDAPWGYLVVGLATFLENSVGAGVIVPGETLVILGGVYASDVGDLWLPAVATVAVVGAVLGDNIGYLIGRRYGRGFLYRHGRKLFITPERIATAERYYASHGGKTIFLARFIPVVRSVGFIVAGVAHMEWKRFIVYDIAGSLVWGVTHSIVGYALGESYERWARYSTPAGLILLLLLVFLIVGSKLLARRRRIRGELEQAPTGLRLEHDHDRGA